MPYVPDRRSRAKRFKRKRSFLSNRNFLQRTIDVAPQNQMSRFMSKFNPFPAVHYATLRYVTKITLQPTQAAKAATHYFRANSIHDPDYTGLTFGGQPYGHDTYQHIYNHYQVLGSTITAVGIPDTNRPAPGLGVLLQDNNNIIEDEARQLCAMKGSSYANFGFNVPVTIRRSFSTKYMQDKSTQCAQFGSDPADPMYFVVFSLDDSSVNTIMNCTVTINYKVKMWELKDLSAM